MRHAKFVLLLLLVIPLCAQVSAGTPPIETRFELADVACLGTVLDVSGTVQAPRISPRRRVLVDPLRVYKGVMPRSADLLLQENFGLAPKTKYLLLLRRDMASEVEIIDVIGVPQSLGSVVPTDGGASFEDDLIATLEQSGADALDSIHLLGQFSALSQRGQTILRKEAASKVPEIALLSLATVLTHDIEPQLYFHMFVERLGVTPVEQWPSFDDLTSLFERDAARPDEAALERVAGSSRLDIRYDALAALRKLADPATTRFFLRQLTASDELSQYLSLISLAEIYRKTGDYAPGLGLFESDKARYLRLWQQWSRENGYG